MPLAWADGTVVAPDAPGRVRLSVSSLGRAWIVPASDLEAALRWLDGHGTRPPLIDRLITAGVLVEHAESGARGDLGTTRRMLQWASSQQFADGADPGGAARTGALGRFGAADLAAIRTMGQISEADQPLPPDLAEAVWVATERTRRYCAIVGATTQPSALMLSYGSAHDLYVLDAQMTPDSVARADLRHRGKGAGQDADLRRFLDTAGYGAVVGRGIAVVGRFDDYQVRYRHEKALGGFLVDGGRILGEVARAVAGLVGAAMVSDAPLPATASTALGLDPMCHLVVGVVLSDRSRDAGRTSE